MSDLSAPSQPTRILFYYPGVQLDTGSPHALVSVVESLAGTPVQPLFLANRDGPLVAALRQRGVEIVNGAPEILSARHPLQALRAIRRSTRFLKSLNVDLIHLHEAGWNYDLLIAASLLRIPIVMHVHNPVVATRRNVHWLLARRIVFVSNAHRASAQYLSRIAHKADVIYNAVKIDRFRSGTSRRAELNVPDGAIVVGTVAQISHRKGIDLLLDAAALLRDRIPNLLFLIAGPDAIGEKDFVAAMKARAADPALGGCVRFLGPRSDIGDFLASCDVFCLPTRAEPFGLAVVEAMAASCPVVASRVGGIPEILETPDLGRLVETLDASGFAEGIEAVLRLPDRGRSMGQTAAGNVAGRFDPTVVSARWRALYADLLR